MLPDSIAPGPRHVILTAFTVLLVLASAGAQTQDGIGQPVPLSAQSEAGEATQVPAQAAPAYIAIVEGAATVERDGLSQSASPNAPYLPGDRLRTARGRTEALFPDGTVLDVDEDTTVDLQAPSLVRLVSGCIILTVRGTGNPSAVVRYQIDTPAASARTRGAGEYRVAVIDGPASAETELTVLRGSASFDAERGSVLVAAGERSVVGDGGAPSVPRTFNSARLDAFDRWAEARREDRLGATSAAYLPRDLRMYGGTFDRYGTWQETPSYGPVWYPDVEPDWQPYYYGYWASYRPWGWTWIGFDAWAWPTHHFGRWGFLGHRWFWIPGRTWAPAWVSWGSAPGFVSWCPLGFDGRPALAFSAAFSHRWTGWTIVPRNTFGLVARVDRVAIGPHQLPSSTQFVFRHAAPVALAAQAGRAGRVGQVAVPRGETIAGARAWNETAPRRSYQTGPPSSFAIPRSDVAVQRRSGRIDRQAPPLPPQSERRAAPRLAEPRLTNTPTAAPRRAGQAGQVGRAGQVAVPRSEFPRAPTAAPRFERAPAPTPRFDRAPVAAPRFERSPVSTPRFERSPVSTPRFERAPAKAPRFERPPAPVASPRVERPPFASTPRSRAPAAVPRSVDSGPRPGGSPHGGSGGSGPPAGGGHHRR
jgi:hypothetical protein